MTFHKWMVMKAEVLRRAFGREPFSVAEAREVWGIRNVASTLNRLKEAGIIERVGRGTYRITSNDTPLRIERGLEQSGIQALRARRAPEMARLAERRWQAWLDTGYVTKTGPRSYRIRVPDLKAGGARVRIR